MPGRCVRVVLKLVALWMVCFLAVELYFTAFVKLQSNDGGPAVPQSEMVRHIVINNSDVRAASRSIKAPESLASRTTVNLHKVSDLSRRERSITSVKSGSESKQPNNRNSSTKPSKSRRQTELNDIFISVKTSKWYHDRLDLILETWYIMARDQVYFFTDEDNDIYRHRTRGHLINTNCSSTYDRYALCCKMSIEYDTFIASKKRWFCHVDDDTYVNVPALVTLLQLYNDTGDWYLGKPSLSYPLKTRDLDGAGQQIAFWFATGGAGFCLSRGIALKMVPFASGGRLVTACRKIRLPDDCTIGYFVYISLNKQLTVVNQFHSHLEGLWRINLGNIANQVTFSYGQLGTRRNVVQIPGYNDSYDPSR
ncbi:hypothetical protein NP493_120g01019 [Ridgeia piscesae]|uniref:Fringe-like glycosyltransferase domain-containing protein n=1 Tax=Ridgeia piscesae TaxID=27915 RepID=A0AAD9P675_RIDPI|nr:hypothetical protein NP493_120g01019 [Ridgeia piscesae]